MEPGVFYFIINKNAAWAHIGNALSGLDSPGGKQIYGDRLPRFVVCQSHHPEKKSFLPHTSTNTSPFSRTRTYLDPFADFFQAQKRHWLFTE